MKLLFVLFALIAAALAAPQFGTFCFPKLMRTILWIMHYCFISGGFGSPYGGYGGNRGGYGGGGFSGSSANAAASSQSFGGGFGGFSGSAANAGASSQSFGFGK